MRNGYEYKPVLEPIGKVVLRSGEQSGYFSLIYGEKDGKYYYTGPTKTLVNPNHVPDKVLQIIVGGNGDPVLKYDGYCNVMQSNNKIMRKALNDKNKGNAFQTIQLYAQYIEKCEVNNNSQSGSLSLRLLEESETIFEDQIETQETKIIYLKKK